MAGDRMACARAADMACKFGSAGWCFSMLPEPILPTTGYSHCRRLGTDRRDLV